MGLRHLTMRAKKHLWLRMFPADKVVPQPGELQREDCAH